MLPYLFSLIRAFFVNEHPNRMFSQWPRNSYKKNSWVGHDSCIYTFIKLYFYINFWLTNQESCLSTLKPECVF